MRFLSTIVTPDNEAIILFKGEKYHVKFELLFDKYTKPDDAGGTPICHGCKFHIFKRVPDDTPLSNSVYGGHYCVVWSPYPNFIQDQVCPATDDGIPYDFLCTVEDGWGDSGNHNIFIRTEMSKESMELGTHQLNIIDTYVESSCH